MLLRFIHTIRVYVLYIQEGMYIIYIQEYMYDTVQVGYIDQV